MNSPTHPRTHASRTEALRQEEIARALRESRRGAGRIAGGAVSAGSSAGAAVRAEASQALLPAPAAGCCSV